MHPELDDQEVMRSIDRSDMLSQIMAFPADLSSAIDVDIGLDLSAGSMVICGMGGSAIGGEILVDRLTYGSRCHSSVVRGSELPGWVDDETMVVVVSYSGNTRESITMFRRALGRGTKLVGVTSGGVLLELCDEYAIPCARIPTGYQPRAALGHILGALSRVVEEAGIAPLAREIGRLIDPLIKYQGELGPSVPSDRCVAKGIALALRGRIPVVYSSPCLRSAATRWHAQINENAKMMAFSGTFPECNHNHIVGWLEGRHDAPFIPVFLKGSSEEEGDVWTLERTIDYMRDAGIDPLVVGAQGHSPLHNALSAVMLGDFVSYYLAMLNRVDPLPVACILELKRRMR